MRKFFLFVSAFIFGISFLAKSQSIVITEIMYNPPESGTDSLEFIELFNNTSSAIDLTDYVIYYGTTSFTFVSGQGIPADGYIAVAQDSAKAHDFYGAAFYQGATTGISNGGTAVYIKDNLGNTIDSLTYDDAAPWPIDPDGNGPSLVLCDPSSDNTDGANWSASNNQASTVAVNSLLVYASPAAANCTTTADPVVAFTQSAASVLESAGTITVSVGINFENANQTDVDFEIASSGTAVLGVDFSVTPGTLSFPASTSTEQTINITLIDNSVQESNRTIVLKLTNPTNNATIGPIDSVTVTILDDDAVVQFGECLNLFISEYIEGSSNNKALELYNPTDQDIDLSNYSLVKFMNGSTVPETPLMLSGTIVAGGVYLLANSSAVTDLTDVADTATSFINHNGNDAYALLNYTDTIDKFGAIGLSGAPNFDIGTETGAAANHTLVRKADIHMGELDWSLGNLQWDVYSSDDFTYFGSHTMNPCVVSAEEVIANEISIYPNPANSYINIENANGKTMVIVDLAGRELFCKTINSNHDIIDLGNFESGIYFVTLKGNNQDITLKLVKE